MRISTSLGAGLLTLLLLGACSDADRVSTGDDPTDGTIADDGDVSARPPELVGTITSVEPFVPITEGCTPPEDLDPDGAVSDDDPPICTPEDSDILGTILVEEDPADPQGGRKISFTVTEASLFFGQDADGADVTAFDDLAEGQQVRAWVTGDGCAESYPEQCGLEAVDVTG